MARHRSVVARASWIFLLASVAVSSACTHPTHAGPATPHQAPPSASGDATTVVLVRHAEKVTDDPTDRDPDLTDVGRARARALAETLAEADVAAVYVTQYRRTRLTGEPIAERFDAPITARPCCNPDVPTWSAALATEILREHPGETVLVVGHSNTIPDLVAAFSGHHPGSMTEAEYDRLFVVVAGAGEPRLIHGRFGVAAP